MSKYHVRRDTNGDWQEENGQEIPVGSSVVYHYGDAPVSPTNGRVIGTIRSNNPHYSNNAGIHADQVASFNKQCVRGTHYEAGTGRLVSTSSAAREREARRRGMSFG